MEQIKHNSKTSKMVKTALLGAMGALLMFFSFPIPLAPPFMEIDLGDVPVLLSGFALGPLSGVITTVIKLLVKFVIKGTSTGGVGELSNLIVSGCFVFVASWIYHKKKTKKNVIRALILGVLAMSFVATISNYFFIFPFYGIDLKVFSQSFHDINPMVSSPLTFLLFSVVPFNIVKGSLCSVVTVLLYKPLRPLLK